MPPGEVGCHYEGRLRMMRWAQNFGLRGARARDESVSVPNSMSMGYSLVSGDGAERVEEEDGD